MDRKIDVVAYDPRWPEFYLVEAEALRAVFGSALESIHHVGSTSVPGLAAKPIVDILVVLDETVAVGRFDSRMEALGYRVRGECLDAGGTPGRFYYSKPVEGGRTHQVHVCARGHFQIAELVLFAAYLRERGDVAEAYARLKLTAVAEGADHTTAYMARKRAWLRAAVRDALTHFGQPDRRTTLEEEATWIDRATSGHDA